MAGIPEGELVADQTTKMKTLKELVIEKRCRKGKCFGIAKIGAFWMACDPIMIRSYGGDGVGQNAPDGDIYLQLRHYRNGEVKAFVHAHEWHQNHGTSDSFAAVSILDCRTVEEVIVVLKGARVDEASVYESYFQGDLTKALLAFGMVEALPAPDEDGGAQ